MAKVRRVEDKLQKEGTCVEPVIRLTRAQELIHSISTLIEYIRKEKLNAEQISHLEDVIEFYIKRAREPK